jgi:hypothetical protein
MARALGSAEQQPCFFGVAFPLMHSTLPELATMLMQTTLRAAADPTLGPTAGPSFQYAPATVEQVRDLARKLTGVRVDRGQAYQQVWDATLERVDHSLTKAASGRGVAAV